MSPSINAKGVGQSQNWKTERKEEQQIHKRYCDLVSIAHQDT